MSTKRTIYILDRDVDGIPAGTVGVATKFNVTFTLGVKSITISRKFLSTYPVTKKGK
jgi:hypothetical protein